MQDWSLSMLILQLFRIACKDYIDVLFNKLAHSRGIE